MLSHRNIIANCRGAWQLLAASLARRARSSCRSCRCRHSYEHTVGQFLPIAMRRPDLYAEGVEHARRNMLEARPTILTLRAAALRGDARQRILRGVTREGGIRRQAVPPGARARGQGATSRAGAAWSSALVDAALDRLVREQGPRRASAAG